MKVWKRSRARRVERGFTLIELMIAMVILAIGLGALTVLFVTAMQTDTKNARDTSATMVAQGILEQISSQPAASGSAALSVTDCAGNVYLVGTDGGAVGGAGNGAKLVPQSSSSSVGFPGDIDWAQGPPTAATSAVTGYSIAQYADCTPGAGRVTYEVRWNVKQVTAYSRTIVVGAREVGSRTVNMGRLRFAMPVSLRSVGGQ